MKEMEIANEKKIAGAKSPSEAAAAWAPYPKNPPLYLDLPTQDGVPVPRYRRNSRPMRRWPLWISTLEI
jgi:hypothetical protein